METENTAFYPRDGFEREETPGMPKRDWTSVQNALAASNNAQRTAGFDQGMAVSANIENSAKQAEAQDRNNRNMWLCRLADSAYRNGGLSHPSLSQAASKDLGQRVYGMQYLTGLTGAEAKHNGSYAVYGDVQNPDGSTGVGITGYVKPQTLLQTYQKMGAGPNSQGIMRQFWKDMGGDMYTPEQLAQMGIRNPNAPTPTLTAGQRLAQAFGFGEPRRRGVSSFASDGRGGWTSRDIDGNVTEGGTRSKDSDGKWDEIESGPNGNVYRNSKTGETVRTAPGENLRDALAKPDVEKARRGRGHSYDDGKDARLAAQIKARRDSENAKNELQERKMAYRQYVDDMNAMRSYEKELRGKKDMLGNPLYTEDQIAEMARNKFPQNFDEDGNPVRWDYGAKASRKDEPSDGRETVPSDTSPSKDPAAPAVAPATKDNGGQKAEKPEEKKPAAAEEKAVKSEPAKPFSLLEEQARLFPGLRNPNGSLRYDMPVNQSPQAKPAANGNSASNAGYNEGSGQSASKKSDVAEREERVKRIRENAKVGQMERLGDGSWARFNGSRWVRVK